MNKSYHLILTSVWLLACLVTTTATAREEVASNLRLITSVPEDDYSPSLTPDGKWAVFVSERTGDKQLFTTPLTPGAVAPARQLAPNPGDDYSPQISPDGKCLAWVSTREDAFGDVWVMKYPDGKPIQVSKRGQRDTNPLWRRTENGLLLAYETQDPDGVRRTVAAKAGEWIPRECAAALPATGMTIPFDAFVIEAPSSPEQPWVLVADDTNGDGRFDARDKRTAWTVSLDGQQWRQITPPLAGLNAPRLSGGVFVLSLALRDDLDIAVVQTPFEIAALTNSVHAVRAATRMWEEFPFDPYTPVSYLRQAYLLAPGTEEGFAAILQASDILGSADRPEQALAMLAFVKSQSKLSTAACVELAYRQASLSLAKSERDRLAPDKMKTMTDNTVKSLSELAGSSTDLSASIRARILMEQAKIRLKQGNPAEALTAARQIEQNEGTPRRLLAQAALLRGEIFAGLGTPTETARAYRAIVADFNDQADLSEEAAVRVASLSMESETNTELRIQALSRLQGDTLSGVRSAAALLEGRLAAASGDTKGAKDIWNTMLGSADTNPRLAARAAFELGNLHAQLGEYQKAIDVFESITAKLRDQLFGGAPALYRQAKQKRVDEYLAKGNYELQVGDSRLALATFSELARLEPDVVEVWRGILEAQSRCGLLDAGQVASYSEKARIAPANALQQYIYGLALTYAKPMPNNTIPQLERAIQLDGSVPYFHQTLGFVHEHFGRLRNSSEDRSAALNEYERALILLTSAGEVRSVDYARLLINSGNAALAVGSYHRAADLYERRMELGTLFDSPANEFLMQRSAGIAFSRASRPNQAFTAFENALKLMSKLVPAGLLSDEQARETATELRDRAALALLNAGRYAEAAAAFAEVARAASPRSPSQVRAWRSCGFALHRLALGQAGTERDRTLVSALSPLNGALALLDAGTVPEKVQKSGGMFQLDVTVSADNEAGGASLGFSPAQERRLILSALSRVFEDLGMPDAAVARLRDQMAAPVPAKEETLGYYTTARLVALDRLAFNLQSSGKREEAAATLLEAVKIARYSVKGETHINANALSLCLSRLAELALSGDNPPFKAAHLAATWLFSQPGLVATSAQAADSLTCTESALQRALELRDPKTSEYILQWGVQRSRVILARALVLERLADVAAAKAGDPLDGLRSAALAASAVQLAYQTIEIAGTVREGGEVKRLALMGHALLIRQAIMRGKADDALPIINNALSVADRCGFPELRWWLRAQGALVATVPSEHADAVLKELEDLVPGSSDPDAPIPVELLNHCERTSIAKQLAAGSWENAWSLAERWRAARLRLMFVAYRPKPGTGSTENNSFMESAMALRGELQHEIGKVRARPLSDTSAADLAALRKIQERMRGHLENGRTQQLAGAMLLAPQATPFEDACVLLETDQRFPGGVALILSSAGKHVGWIKTGLVKLETPEAWTDLEKRAPFWFVLGDRLSRNVSKGTAVVNMLTFETTFARIADPRLAIGTGVAKWPPVNTGNIDFPDSEGLKDALIGADSAVLTTPLVATGLDPMRWKLLTTSIQAGSVLDMLPPLSAVSAVIQMPTSATGPDKAAREEVLAAALAATGAATVNVNGQTWVAPVIPIAAMRELAESWIAADSGKIKAALARNDNAGAVAPLRRLLRIREELQKPANEIVEAASLLAGVEGRLERWDQATEAASKAVDALLPKGDSEALAMELSRYGSFLNDSRKFNLSYKAYTEAAAVYERKGNARRHVEMLARSGVALENGGRYEDALAVFDQAGKLAADMGDKAQEARQFRRKGKIYLQRQNRYVEAEEAFKHAGELSVAANKPEDVLMANLDVARVKERMGSYAEAAAIASTVENGAIAQKLPLLQSDALLTRALVEWASADYFHAFKSQREGLRIADDLNDRPFQIIGHNMGGLIGWALNDSETAMQEFDAALKLAQAGLFKAEVASTLNNRGLVYRSTARYDAALGEFAAALSIDRAESNDWGIAYSQRNIGLTHIQRGSPSDAIEPLDEAIRLAAAIGDRANRAKALVAMGDARRALGDAAPARQNYLDALTEARAIPLPEMEWRALYGLALLAREGKNLAEARKMFTEAIDVVERLRASIKIEELQDGFLLDKQSLYDEMVRLLLDEGSAKDAFEFSERSRGRNFIDMLGSQKIQPGSEVDKAALEREEKLRATVETLGRRFAAAQPAEKQKLQDELADARRNYTQFIIGLRADNPQLSSFVSVPTMDLASLQKLLDAETRLVVYHVLPDELVAWVIGPESFNVVRTKVKRTEIVDVLGTYRRHLQRFDNISTEERMLSGWLIAPAESLLTGAKRVGIIPHRELHQMPFSATRLGNGYIIDKLALFYAPSASVIQYTFDRRKARNKSEKVLAIGNPNLGSKSLDLPFAEKEASRIKWSFPDATVVTGSQATETWVARNIGEYGIIHIASHGEYNEHLPLLSAVKLAPDSEDNGDLTTRKIFGLSIKADLIALSACQTGLGKVGNGDDIVGLNRAFVYAGTHEILSSLWRVDDVATAVLIKYFYRNMAGRDRAEALRQAQLEVRSQYRHPAYWAGLFLSGDWQ